MDDDLPVLDPAAANVEIVELDATYELGIKRLYLPLEIHWTCPKCGSRNTREMRHDHMSYPTINAIERINLWCGKCDVDDQGEPVAVLRVVPRFTLELVGPEEPEYDEDEPERDPDNPAT